MTSSRRPENARRETLSTVRRALPLLTETPAQWAHLAASRLPEFLADHAVCEQQAAVFALSLVAHYPDDSELVERMCALAAEEIAHLRRVSGLLGRRGFSPAKRRTNPWAKGLHDRIARERSDLRKIDRLLVGALIEARSCERFTTLLSVLDDPEVEALLDDLGPAEERHWQLFHALAARETDADTLADRWQGWLEHEASLARQGGRHPTVHG